MGVQAARDQVQKVLKQPVDDWLAVISHAATESMGASKSRSKSNAKLKA